MIGDASGYSMCDPAFIPTSTHYRSDGCRRIDDGPPQKVTWENLLVE